MADRMIYRDGMSRKIGDAVQRGGANNKAEKTSKEKSSLTEVDDVTKDIISQLTTKINQANDPAFVKNLRDAFKGVTNAMDKKTGEFRAKAEEKLTEGLAQDFMRNMKDQTDKSISNFVNSLRKAKLFRGSSSAEDDSTSEDNGNANQTDSTEETSDDIVEFSYVPGDTFGQKIIDLGLATDNGLWGDNGDVAYYTQQLRDQGALDERGNVKLGQTFRLRRRK